MVGLNGTLYLVETIGIKDTTTMSWVVDPIASQRSCSDLDLDETRGYSGVQSPTFPLFDHPSSEVSLTDQSINRSLHPFILVCLWEDRRSHRV